MVELEEGYEPIGRLTTNGWDADRFLLTDVEKADWMKIAASVQAAFTDDVIDAALRRMPVEYYRLRGPGDGVSRGHEEEQERRERFLQPDPVRRDVPVLTKSRALRRKEQSIEP